MPGKNTKSNKGFNRRRFIGNTIKLAVLGTLLPDVSCNNKRSSPAGKGPDTTRSAKNGKHVKKARKKWSHEGLVMNSQTKVMHFPSSRLYTYYDEIKPNHLQEISLAAWTAQLQEPVRLNRAQSGNILEILTLQHLQNGVNDEYLTAAAETLSKAFMPACENSKGVNLNSTNFRLHELMLQLLSLNSSVTDKWQSFNSRVKRPPALRNRQKWMETETAFNARVQYILTRQSDYMNRLTERARKYSFT